MGHQDYLLKLCYVAALLDGTRGFSVDLLRQKKSTVKQCSDCWSQPPNLYPTTHKKICHHWKAERKKVLYLIRG